MRQGEGGDPWLEQTGQEELELPHWHEAESRGDWRNYVSLQVQLLWPTFSGVQKQALHECFQRLADLENVPGG